MHLLFNQVLNLYFSNVKKCFTEQCGKIPIGTWLRIHALSILFLKTRIRLKYKNLSIAVRLCQLNSKSKFEFHLGLQYAFPFKSKLWFETMIRESVLQVKEYGFEARNVSRVAMGFDVVLMSIQYSCKLFDYFFSSSIVGMKY